MNISIKDFFRPPADAKIDQKFIIFLVILSFLTLGGLFIYDKFWGFKGIQSVDYEKKASNTIKVQTGVRSGDSWGASSK